MFKEKRITNIPYLMAVVIVCFIVLPFGLLVTGYEYLEELKQMEVQENDIFNQMQSEIMIELHDNFALLEFYFASAEEKLMNEVKIEGQILLKIIEEVVWKEKRLGIDYSSRILRDLIRPMRFGEEKGYYFAFTSDGVAQILPMNIDLEGKNILDLKDPDGKNIIRDMLRLVNESGSGIYRYKSFLQDNDGHYPEKIAFVRSIPNLNWIVGAVEYVDDVEGKAKKTYLDIVQKITFHRSDFTFVMDRSKQISIRFLNQDQSKFSSDFSKHLTQDKAFQKDGCFQFEEGNSPYLVCFRYFKPWHWTIGFGVETTRIDSVIKAKKNALRQRLKTELVILSITLLMVTLAVILIGRHLKNTIENGFFVFADFFKNASLRNTTINIDALKVVEFKKLAVYANNMVNSLNERDQKILNYTGELEKANRALEEMATRDGLTGVFNRRYFDTIFEKEHSRAKRDKSTLSLVLIDIDFFKVYNDTYGHQEGDECLKKMAASMSNVLKRPGDVFARFGGEEFAALLPDTDASGAVNIASGIQKAVAGLSLPHEGSSVSDCVTISMGISVMMPDQEINLDELISRADKSLYQAKHQGRNCFAVFKA